MPYIQHQNRSDLNQHLEPLLKVLVARENNEGDLNYSISFLLDALARSKPCYATVNRLVGALECAKIEFYRRVAAPYEDAKIIQNGDVYAPQESN